MLILAPFMYGEVKLVLSSVSASGVRCAFELDGHLAM